MLLLLDLKNPFVSVGPFEIQAQNFYGPNLPELPKTGDYGERWRIFLRHIASKTGTIFFESKIGIQQGYGHGTEIFLLTNQDGSLIYKMSHTNHCEGPGFSCSYNHGPWYKYGEYRGDIPADPELLEALRLKGVLEKKFKF